MSWDCIIVGGGPAGLSAALMLGRCRRRVLLCDVGNQRNLQSHALHAYLTRDGVSPSEFLRLARAELGRYGTVECRELEIVEAAREDRGFAIRATDGTGLRTRKLLLATGVVDELPALEGLDALYGTSVHHCPYCDAWEWRDRPLAAYGEGDEACGLALSLTFWSPDVLLCTGGAELPDGVVARLTAAGVRIREEPVLRLEGSDGRLERILFASGEPAPRSALFVVAGQRQRSPLAERLGCHFTVRGTVDTGTCEVTNIPGLFVAGDASKEAQFVAVAAAEGTQAAMAIHKALMKEDLP
ncbi:MAG TPA: NAD(P)/FAD-dependent oxidoreductase [Gemmatimonadales bacterium]